MTYRRYQSTQSMVETPAALEMRAFGFVNSALESAGSNTGLRASALQRNLRLWSLLQNDLLDPENGLPDETKKSLLRVAYFAQDYSYKAIGTDMPLEPVIAVNRDIMEGLAAQMAAVRATPAVQPGAVSVAG